MNMNASPIINFEDIEARMLGLSAQEPPLVLVRAEADIEHYEWQMDEWRIGYYPPNSLWDLDMFSVLTRERVKEGVQDMRLYTFWGRGLLRCMHMHYPANEPFVVNKLFDSITSRVRKDFHDWDTPNEEDIRDFNEAIGWIYTR